MEMSSSRASAPASVPAPAPAAATSLPEITRKLQSERDALRAEVEELTRRLAQERAARSTLENEAQLRELELRHLQQRGAQAAQQARDKLLAVEKELEDEAAMHKMAVLGRNAATHKNTTLAAELKAAELKYKKELEKKEIALAEAELAREEARALKADREQLVQRTESDARRVRELWQQISREHEVKVATLQQELLNARESSNAADETIADYKQKVAQLEETLQTVREEKVAMKQQLTEFSSARSRLQEQETRERHQEKHWGDEQHRLTLDLQGIKNKCELLEQREAAASKERDAATSAAAKAESELQERLQELLVLKTEFAELLDKHESLTALHKQSAREREAQLTLQTQKLRDGKRCAQELAHLRAQEISGYKQVIYSVNARLREAQELSQTGDRNAWALVDASNPSKETSLCIYRH